VKFAAKEPSVALRVMDAKVTGGGDLEREIYGGTDETIT